MVFFEPSGDNDQDINRFEIILFSGFKAKHPREFLKKKETKCAKFINLYLIGIWLILTTIMIQALVLVGAHRAQKGYKVGVIDPSLGQESFFFRSHRAFWNSLENIVPLLGMSI